MVCGRQCLGSSLEEQEVRCQLRIGTIPSLCCDQDLGCASYYDVTPRQARQPL